MAEPCRVPPDAPAGLTINHWAFKVTDHKGRVWDVYHYMLDEDANISPTGICPGTIAFRYDERIERWIQGLSFTPGHLIPEQALADILAGPRQ